MICSNELNCCEFRSSKYITDNQEKLKFDFHVFLKKEDSADVFFPEPCALTLVVSDNKNKKSTDVLKNFIIIIV